MGTASNYWQWVRIDAAGKRQRQEMPAVKAFFHQQFSEQSEVLEIPDLTIQRQLVQRMQGAEGADRQLAEFCLRCFISHQVEQICLQLEAQFGRPHGFRCDDLLPLVLNDEVLAGRGRPMQATKYRSIAPMGRAGETLATAATSRGGSRQNTRSAEPFVATAVSSQLSQLQEGTQVQFRVENNESIDLYVSLLLINAEGDLSVIFPVDWNSPDDAALVSAGTPVVVPDARRGDEFQYTVSAPFGNEEVLVLASATPLRRALLGLRNIAARQGQSRGAISLDGSIDRGLANDVVGDLLSDLDEGTRGLTQTSTSTNRSIGAGQLAALSIAYQTVPASP